MSGQIDNRDQRESRALAVVLLVLVVGVVVALWLLLPSVSALVAVHLSPGLGLKEAALLAFVITLVVLLVLAVASGDGLLGEIQFVLAAFFLFFIIIWLLLAWIF